jgi:cell division protease FtsH
VGTVPAPVPGQLGFGTNSGTNNSGTNGTPAYSNGTNGTNGQPGYDASAGQPYGNGNQADGTPGGPPYYGAPPGWTPATTPPGQSWAPPSWEGPQDAAPQDQPRHPVDTDDRDSGH